MGNVKADDAYGRLYDEKLPNYLHNRPPSFVNHCLTRLESSQVFSGRDISRRGLDAFQVKSYYMFIFHSFKLLVRGTETKLCNQ